MYFALSRTHCFSDYYVFSEAAMRKCFEGLQVYEKETATQVFSSEYCEILGTPFFVEHLWWLLL